MFFGLSEQQVIFFLHCLAFQIIVRRLYSKKHYLFLKLVTKNFTSDFIQGRFYFEDIKFDPYYLQNIDKQIFHIVRIYFPKYLSVQFQIHQD